MPEEILNLSTIVKRSTVNITSKRHPGGHLYEFLNRADLGPYEFARIAVLDQEVQKLRAVTKLTTAQTRQLKKALADMVTLIVPTIEPAVLKELTEQQQQMIVLTWTSQMAEEAAGAAEGNAPTRRRRTTAASSRGSKRSTAATPKRGSTSRRGS